MSRRLLACSLVAILAVGACGGGEGGDEATDTTEAGGTPTTEAPVTSTEGTDADDDGGQTVDIGDIPQECVEAFVGYLRAIEPVVEEVDWANASLADFEDIGASLESITEEYEAEIADSNCEDLDVDASGEESFQYMIDLASREAPGTVPYFEMIRDFAAGVGEGSDIVVSNDCETDIATMQAIVDEGVPMQDMPANELGAMGGLITSISANCSQERSFEFFSQEDVAAYMAG
ncbi:MAG TPA: hypothetical protein VFZ80_02300 [Acidimicrobiia bacterium]